MTKWIVTCGNANYLAQVKEGAVVAEHLGSGNVPGAVNRKDCMGYLVFCKDCKTVLFWPKTCFRTWTPEPGSEVQDECPVCNATADPGHGGGQYRLSTHVVILAVLAVDNPTTGGSV